jgi:hypothetical protein
VFWGFPKTPATTSSTHIPKKITLIRRLRIRWPQAKRLEVYRRIFLIWVLKTRFKKKKSFKGMWGPKDAKSKSGRRERKRIWIRKDRMEEDRDQ